VDYPTLSWVHTIKGIDAQVLSTIDLSPYISNYQLRLRKITFEAGGVAAMHSYKDRPSFAYVLEGTLTELRDGGYKKEYGHGGVITESRDVTHWAENQGTTKEVLVGVDILKP
jgi:quercetin dioxygenase-like cupin family protein